MPSDNKPIAKKAVGAAALGGLLALLGIPGAAIGAGIAGAAEEYRTRRHERQSRQFGKLLEDLSRRVKDLEGATPLQPEEVDPFWSLVEHAVADEEDRKLPFYAAALEWYLRDKPPSSLIKQLSEAIRAATFLELYAFVDGELYQFRHSRRAINDLYGGDTALYERIATLGLAQNVPTRGPGHGHVRPIGKVLLAGIDLESLAFDPSEVKRSHDAVQSVIQRSGRRID